MTFLFLLAYFLIGLAVGAIVLRWPGAKYESAAGTLASCSFAWPLVVPIGGLFVLAAFFDWLAHNVIGAEDYPSDTHGW
jgi:hypothetical protein